MGYTNLIELSLQFYFTQPVIDSLEKAHTRMYIRCQNSHCMSDHKLSHEVQGHFSKQNIHWDEVQQLHWREQGQNYEENSVISGSLLQLFRNKNKSLYMNFKAIKHNIDYICPLFI